MAWTPPMTAVAGAVFTAADYNTNIRDNLIETVTGLAVDPLQIGVRWPVTASRNRIVMRNVKQSIVNDDNPYRGSDWGDLATPGPVVTFMATSGSMIVGISAIITTYRVLSAGMMSFSITESDPTQNIDAKIFLTADTVRSIGYQRGSTGSFVQEKRGGVFLITGLEPERFYWIIAKYRLEAGTALSDTPGAAYQQRSLFCLGL